MEKPESPKDEAPAAKGTPFKDMSPRQKVLWILKLSVSILTFGMAFPNVMSD